MSSKRRFSYILSVGVIFSLLMTTSCSRFLDEKRETPQTIEMSNSKFSCLQALPEELTKFVKGTVSNEDIGRGFECAKGALNYFKNKTKGTTAEAYTMEDLRNFFGKYFLKNNNVSPAFGMELFKLKQVLLGGSERYITKAEIQRLLELMDVLRDQAIILAPHVPTLLGDGQKTTWVDVDNATAKLGQALWTLFKHVDLATSTYRFEDLKKFMEGLDSFINSAEPFSLTEKIGDNVALVEAGKNVLIGENNTLNDVYDWQAAVSTVMALYREGLRYLYFLKGNNLSGPEHIGAILLVAEDALNLLEESLPVQNQGSISFASIDKLLDLLAGRRMLPMNLSSRSIKETYKKVVLRMLDPHRRGDSRGLQGLERTHILALKQELRIFKLHQKFIDSLKFQQDGTISFDEIKKGFADFSAHTVISRDLTQETLEQEALHLAWREGVSLLLREFPVFYNREGRQVILGGANLYSQSWASLTRWNVMRALTRALLLGYGQTHNPQVSQEVIVESGLELWYADFNQIGVEVKAFDPRSLNSGSRSFKEANFFTSGGNGDAIMDYRETFDFVSLLFSGGLSSAEFIRKDILAQKCAINVKDIFGYPMMNEGCFSTTLRKHFGEYFNNLPGMVLEVKGMKDPQWNEFYGNLMAASRVSPAAGGQIETSDLRTAVMILHYAENLMSVYDANHDGKLNINELRKAAPRFMEFMRAASPLKADFVVEDFFLFLVYKGKKPTATEFAIFQGEKAFDSLLDVGRDKILRVFKVLKDEAAKK